MGDSKLVIDWARKKNVAQYVKLEHVLRDINLAFLSFE
jgi:hypothetical protein